MPATGARPAGAADEAGAATAVRQMFDSIAPNYDLLNHVLSANVDRLWWRRAARRFKDVLARPEAAVLDICCGTGDLTMALLKLRPRGAKPILAGDFARAMLRRGAEKFGQRELRESADRPASDAPYAVAIEADALHLPLRAESLDLIVTAFGFQKSGELRGRTEGVLSRAEAGRAVGNPGVQRAGRADREGVWRVLPARAACDWPHDLREGWGVQLPADLGGQFSAPRCDGGDDAASGL